jgi:hypothetical protein
MTRPPGLKVTRTMATDYYVRTGDDGVILWLVRVADDGAVDIWNATTAAWVPAPDPSATRALVEPGADPDYYTLPALDVPRVIAGLGDPANPGLPLMTTRLDRQLAKTRQTTEGHETTDTKGWDRSPAAAACPACAGPTPCAPTCDHTACHPGWYFRPQGGGLVYCCDWHGWVTPAEAFDFAWDAYDDLRKD